MRDARNDREWDTKSKSGKLGPRLRERDEKWIHGGIDVADGYRNDTETSTLGCKENSE
jgi:hypothetical protein